MILRSVLHMRLTALVPGAIRFPQHRLASQRKAKETSKVFKEIYSPNSKLDTVGLIARAAGITAYPCNENIKLEDTTKVALVDDNNRMQEKVTFAKVKELAASAGLDIIFKTTFTEVPIVQITDYRLKILKAFIEQNTKLRFEDTKVKEFFTKVYMSKDTHANDLKTVVDTVRRKMNTVEQPVRILLKVDALDKEEIAKAKFLMENLAMKLRSLGSVHRYEDVMQSESELNIVQRSKEIKDFSADTVYLPSKTNEEFDRKHRISKIENEKLGKGYLIMDVTRKKNSTEKISVREFIRKIGSVDKIFAILSEEVSAHDMKSTNKKIANPKEVIIKHMELTREKLKQKEKLREKYPERYATSAKADFKLEAEFQEECFIAKTLLKHASEVWEAKAERARAAMQ